MKNILGLFIALGLASPAIAAGPPQGFLDIGYAPSSDLELSDNTGSIESDGGAGFGARARYTIASGFYVAGEYQRNTYDGFEGVSLDTTVDALRAGAGWRFPDLPFYAQAEFIREKLDFGAPLDTSDSESGFGIHAGAEGQVTEAVTVFGQAGFVDVGDFGDGFEFLAGGAVAITPMLGVFADYRQTQQDNQGAEITVADLRVGLRVSFGQ